MSQHHLLHLSSNLLPPLHMAEKAPAPAESQQGSENEKSEYFQLQRVRSSSQSGQKEQDASCQAVNAAPRPLGLHDLNRQPKTEQASWAERLCHTTFFNPCSQHSSKVYRRCECTHFCMDCPDSKALCSCCLADHSNCRTLQIRRYVYRDVVKVQDIQGYIDTSGIQTYTVNHAQAIFLSAKDKTLVGPYYRVDSSSSCATCHRGLRNGCSYCSLACKLAATQGMTPPEPVKEQRPSRSVKAERKPSKSVSRTPRCSAGGDEDSCAAAEEAFHGHLDSVHPSGAVTPNEPPESAATCGSTEFALSSAISQALEKGKKRTGPSAIKSCSSLPPGHYVPGQSRRKQARPMRASE